MNTSPRYTIKPSQWINIGWIILGVVCLFILPFLTLFCLIKVLDVYCWKYEFILDGSTPCIVEQRGILSIDRKETLIYRIKSIREEEPFLMRLVGLENIYIKSSDPYKPELKLFAVPKGLDLRQMLRNNTQQLRRKEGVREFDTYRL